MDLALGDEVKTLDDYESTGVVVEVFATTVVVRWNDDKSTSRRSPDGLAVIKRNRKADPLRALTQIKAGARIKRRFGDVIRSRMASLGLTMVQLAAKAEVSEKTLWRFMHEDGLERGGVQTLERIAAAIGVPPGEFWTVER